MSCGLRFRPQQHIHSPGPGIAYARIREKGRGCFKISMYIPPATISARTNTLELISSDQLALLSRRGEALARWV